MTPVLVREDRRHFEHRFRFRSLLKRYAPRCRASVRATSSRRTFRRRPRSAIRDAAAEDRRGGDGDRPRGILGIRRSNGIRPLGIGNRETQKGIGMVLASGVALDMSGFKMLAMVRPARRV